MVPERRKHGSEVFKIVAFALFTPIASLVLGLLLGDKSPEQPSWIFAIAFCFVGFLVLVLSFTVLWEE